MGARGFTFVSETEKQCEAYGAQFRELIAGKEAAKNLPRSATVEASKISQGVFYHNLKHPGRWRLEEIVSICNHLGISPVELFSTERRYT